MRTGASRPTTSPANDAAGEALVHDQGPPHLDLARGAVLGCLARGRRRRAHHAFGPRRRASTPAAGKPGCRVRCGCGCSTIFAARTSHPSQRPLNEQASWCCFAARAAPARRPAPVGARRRDRFAACGTCCGRIGRRRIRRDGCGGVRAFGRQRRNLRLRARHCGMTSAGRAARHDARIAVADRRGGPAARQELAAARAGRLPVRRGRVPAARHRAGRASPPAVPIRAPCGARPRARARSASSLVQALELVGIELHLADRELALELVGGNARLQRPGILERADVDDADARQCALARLVGLRRRRAPWAPGPTRCRP